jgi:hypothetical protein
VPSPPRPKFGVPWWALLAVVPFGVVRWIAAGPVVAARGMGQGEAMGFRLGSVLWGLVFACAVAWGAFLIFGRRRGVAAAVFIAVYGFFTLGAIGRAGVALGPARAAAVTNVAPAAGAGPVSQPPASSATPGMAPPRAAFDRATAALRAAQAKTTEPTRRWAASGAFNLSGVKTAQDLDRRIEVLDALGRANREARLAGDAALQQLRGELAAAGHANSVQRELWTAQWAAEVGLEYDRQVALAIEKFLAAGRVQLRMLRQEWGRWRLDPATDRIQFDDAALRDRFTRQAALVGVAEAELNEALRKAKARAAR